MDRQKLIERLPSILLIAFPLFLFLSFAFGHSQYALLEEMTDFPGSDGVIDMKYVLPGMMTLFVILFLISAVLLSSFSFFIHNRRTYRKFALSALISFSFAAIFESVYLFVSIGKSFPDGALILETYNIVNYGLFLLFELFLAIIFYLCRDRGNEE